MPSPLSYEPSVQAIWRDALPAGSRLLAGATRLRNRVAWPVMARSTGLGEIEGGEMVLVPAIRAHEVANRIRDLAAGGVSALVLATADDRWDDATELPVIAVPPETDLRQLQADIERYIARRRRELFALDQELHRSLVDAAIGGLGLAELTTLAARRAGRQVVIDREGEVFAGRPFESVPEDALAHVRSHMQRHDAAPTLVRGSPSALVAPIATGRERFGLSLVFGAEDDLTDDHEVILVSLASAAAIALGREPDAGPDPADVVLAVIESSRDAGETSWTAVAVADDSSGLRRLHRAARSELAARDLDGYIAVEDGHLILLLRGVDEALVSSIDRSLHARTGSAGLRTGVGRGQLGAGGARRSLEQALAALRRAEPGSSVGFGEIETTELWQRDAGWMDFAVVRLGPLLGSRPDQRELLHSLDAYLACGRNAKSAARRLQVHRNTLQYRLRRIETLLDVELDDPDTLFVLELAVRVRDSQEKRR